MGAQHRAGNIDLHHVGERDRRPTHAVLPSRIDPTEVPAPMHRRLARGLSKQGRLADLGAADGKPAKEGTVEAWGRSEDNPVRNGYGPAGYRGRFGMYGSYS